MVLDKIIEWGMALLDWLLSLLDELPQTPDTFNNVIDGIASFLEGGICALNCFLDLDFIKGAMVVWLAIASADKIYHTVMWVLRKIPVINIK